MTAPDNTVTAAQNLIGLGWPVMPIKPGSKEPLTRHGVKDATTDERTVLHWFQRWPTANLAIATGHPGPNVLDIDNPHAAGPILTQLKHAHPPEVATPRGAHLYYQGTRQGTISLGYGELRGQGSYVLVPPSIHPSGKEYIWLATPNGHLQPVPPELTAGRQTAGTGNFEAPELIGHGQRHDALKDAAVRFLRGGFTDVPTLEQMLQAFFHARCHPHPPAKPREFREIAEWAAGSQIAQRERELAHADPDPEPEPGKKTKKKAKQAKELDQPPAGDAPLADHRQYLRAAGGWGDPIDIHTIRRYGTRATDALEIELTNGQWILFDRQDQVTTRGHWPRTVIACTNGIADPIGLTDWEGQKVFRSLCILADAPPERREREDLDDAITELVAAAEPITGHTLATASGCYHITAHCRNRPTYNPRDTAEDAARPALIIDQDGRRYLRAGELRDYLNHHGIGISTSALPGRMRMIGLERIAVNGREEPRPDGPRRTSRMWLYQLPAEPA